VRDEQGQLAGVTGRRPHSHPRRHVDILADYPLRAEPCGRGVAGKLHDGLVAERAGRAQRVARVADLLDVAGRVAQLEAVLHALHGWSGEGQPPLVTGVDEVEPGPGQGQRGQQPGTVERGPLAGAGVGELEGHRVGARLDHRPIPVIIGRSRQLEFGGVDP
jgi:hypothetical protein